MRLHAYLPVLIVTLLLTQFRTRAEDMPAILIDVSSLEKRLKSEKLRVLDTRAEADYREGHIPGAVRVDVSAWTKLGHSEGGFENSAAWSAAVGKLGVDDKTPVVVYGDSPTNTARIWWTLKYVGLKEVLFLDGGWALWTAAKGPTQAEVPDVPRAKFTPKFQKDRLATMAEIKQALKDDSLAIIDTRSDGEFTGKIARGPRGGCIPGAVHLEWKHLLAKDGRFKKPAEIRKLFAESGITKGKPLVPY